MINLPKSVTLCSIFLLSFAGLAASAEFRLGAEFATLSPSKEHEGTSTVMPTIAAGAQIGDGLLLLGEVGVLKYTVDKSGDRSGKMTSSGTIDISGTSLAAVLAKRIGQAELRFGYGVIQYQYKNKLSSDAMAELQFFGVTNYKEDLKNASGTQIIFGVDAMMSPRLLAGVEYRSVTVKPTLDAAATFGGTNYTFSDTADLSHTWLALRLMLAF
jgi:hypothetical protein